MLGFAPERIFRGDHRHDRDTLLAFVQFEGAGGRGKHGVRPLQPAGHAVGRREFSGHVAQNAGGKAQLHGAQHAVVARSDARAREKFLEQRSRGVRIKQNEQPSVLFPVIAQQPRRLGRKIVTRAGDHHGPGIFGNGRRRRERERRGFHALLFDVFDEQGNGRILARHRFALALQEINRALPRLGNLEERAGQRLLALECAQARRFARHLRQIIVFGHVDRADLLRPAVHLDDDKVLLRSELELGLQFARASEVAHRIDVFDGQLVARVDLVFLEQIDHIPVDLVAGRRGGRGKENVDFRGGRKPLERVLGQFARTVFLRGRPIAAVIIIEARVVHRREQHAGEQHLHAYSESCARASAR